ncbi:MAG TPA: hypothetical protein DEP35_09935 [Deltaproteobacteria bacterium]|jgi:hypothetical protein|nr:hypothetical protein [Deltaproteobacteria bacterium]
MPSVPSIKGSVFATVVEDVGKSLAKGAVRRDQLSRWLRPEDIAFLDEKIAVASWYPIHSYTRMGELLRDVEGGGSHEYLRQCGRQTARRLLEAGFYSQLQYLHRAEVGRASGDRARFEAFGRDLRLLTTISASILSFSRWTVKPDAENDLQYVIEVSEAKDFPEVLCWRSDGFVNEMATQHGDSDLWRWSRPRQDLVVFRMTRRL